MRGWLPILGIAVGCGDGIGVADAPPPPDSARGLVSVQYRLANLPGPSGGHPVFFQNVDSSLVLATRTANDGKASAFMAPGGFVTLVAPHALYTFAGVQPGDELVLGRPQVGDPSGPRTTGVRVPPDPGTSSFRLYTSCGAYEVSSLGTSEPVHVDLFGCAQTTDMLLVSNQTGRYLFNPAVALVTGQIELTGPYRTPELATITVAHLPADLAIVHTALDLGRGPSPLLPTEFRSAEPVAGTATTTVSIPVPADGTFVTEVDGTASPLGGQRIVQVDAATTSIAIDYAGLTLRDVTAPTYEASTHALVWTEGSGEAGDAVIARLFSPELGTEWLVIAPRRDEPRLQLPVLPRPQLPGSTWFPLWFATIANDGGYDRIRARLLGSWEPGYRWPVDGETRRVVYRTPTAQSER